MLLLLGGLALTASNKDMGLQKGTSSLRLFNISNWSTGAFCLQGLLLWAVAASPGSSSRQGSSLPGEQIPTQIPAASRGASNSHWAHVPSSRQKSPLLGLFAVASACLLTLGRVLTRRGSSTNASISSPILPAHFLRYSLCFSQPHSHAAIS